MNAARWLPYLLFGLIVGVLVDRYRRKPVVVASDLASGLALAAVPVLAFTHHLGIGLLSVIMAVFGIFTLVNGAASMSLLPRLVPGPLLAAGNARLDQSMSVAQTSGPVLAGGIVSAIGAPVAVLIDAVSYVASGMVLSTISVQEPLPPKRSLRGVRRELAEGLSWLYRHPTLAPLAITTHGWFLFSGLLSAVFVPFALTQIHIGAFGLGVVLACAGIGGLGGALVSARLGHRFGVGPVVIGSNTVLPPAMAAMALAPAGSPLIGGVLLGVGQFLFGLSIGLSNANEMGYRQIVTPDRLQGRTNTTMRSLNRGALVIGSPLGGLLADAIGYRAGLWIAAAGFAVVTIALTASDFRRARFSDARTR